MEFSSKLERSLEKGLANSTDLSPINLGLMRSGPLALDGFIIQDMRSRTSSWDIDVLRSEHSGVVKLAGRGWLLSSNVDCWEK